MISASSSLQDYLTITKGSAKYLVIVFHNLRDYYQLDQSIRDAVDSYCKKFQVGIVGFLSSGRDKVDMFDMSGVDSSARFSITNSLTLTSVITSDHQSLRILKQNITFQESHRYSKWLRITPSDNNIVPILTGRFNDGSSGALIVEDNANVDGVSKIVIGGSRSLQFWFMKTMFLDSLHYLTKGVISFPLTRYILVDIDDIFVGAARLVPSDVEALVESQEEMTDLVTGFQYNLGFSGKYFKNGNDLENTADEDLIKSKDKFWWFPHMWKHIQPHRFDNISDLTSRMSLNKQFADDHGLPVMNQYAVSPHHSGVYPVHQQLYDAWRQVWNIAITSTEEYPGLRPARRRRGFIHDEVHVLPRQTCGLFTKNLHYDEYPGGAGKLEESIQGGELFHSILTNPISIFMTHMPNYGHDQLAPYTFESVIQMIKCWTNLDLRTRSPSALAEIYFEMFSDEKEAIWGVSVCFYLYDYKCLLRCQRNFEVSNDF